MTGLEKIIASILEEARMEAQACIEEAKVEAERILAEENAKSYALCAKTTESAKQQVIDIERACASAVQLSRRKGLLEEKQALLTQTLEQALERLYAMPEDVYFGLLVKMTAAFAEPGEGELLLNERDLSRLPKDFEKSVNMALKENCKLRLSEQARPMEGGIVLKYGEVEQNCSFRAIFTSRLDEMSDRARGILFS